MAVPAQTYVRFACFQTVEGSRQQLGIFQALDEAREAEHAPAWALAEMGALEEWFDKQLPEPDRFKRGNRWKGWGQPGLSWFKPAAEDHIRNMHRLKLALEACGVHVEILTTRDPGEIIYQDDFQLVAEPGNRRF